MPVSVYGCTHIRVKVHLSHPSHLIMSSFKRQHTPSPSQTSSPSRTPKAPRVTVPPSSPLLCTLPPTCHHPNRPTPLSDTRALESHYATHHAHVCSSPECGCVFPDARLLELVRKYFLIYLSRLSDPCPQHLTECHDPLAALRKERGEKIVSFTYRAPSSSRPSLFLGTPPG